MTKSKKQLKKEKEDVETAQNIIDLFFEAGARVSVKQYRYVLEKLSQARRETVLKGERNRLIAQIRAEEREKVVDYFREGINNLPRHLVERHATDLTIIGSVTLEHIADLLTNLKNK